MIRKKPTKKDITQSNTIDIINREGKKLGVGELIRRKPSHYIQDNLPFVMVEKKNQTQDTTTHIWAGERWEVKWTEHDYYKVGDHTCLEVCYFIKTCSQYPSFSEPEYSEHDTNGRVIFIEENGVLRTGEEYNPLAVKALKRVVKKFRGELVVYSHSPHQVRERFDAADLTIRILEFLNPYGVNFKDEDDEEEKEKISTTYSFQDAITDYLYEYKNEIEDYLVLSGESKVDKKVLKNTHQCGNLGLRTV